MRQYLDLCEHVLANGNEKDDRTGTGTRSFFGHQMRFDLAKGFPLMTTKNMVTINKFGTNRLDAIIEELLWMLDGNTNIKPLVDKNINIWNQDAYRGYKNRREATGDRVIPYEEYIEEIKETDPKWQPLKGNLGRIYGAQWRSWQGRDCGKVIDQITNVIEGIKKDPDSRRHIVSAWKVDEIEDMVLPPCHILFQFYVANGKLSCQLYQRSGDIFLGVPFNIASYALLTMMIADQCNLEYGEFIHVLGDAHVYNNHVPQVLKQITREPYSLPKMVINKDVSDIFSYKREDFKLVGYQAHSALKGQVSVGD